VSDVQSILDEFTDIVIVKHEAADGTKLTQEYKSFDSPALAQALLDARTEAAALRLTEENLRAQLERLFDENLTLRIAMEADAARLDWLNDNVRICGSALIAREHTALYGANVRDAIDTVRASVLAALTRTEAPDA